MSTPKIDPKIEPEMKPKINPKIDLKINCKFLVPILLDIEQSNILGDRDTGLSSRKLWVSFVCPSRFTRAIVVVAEGCFAKVLWRAASTIASPILEKKESMLQDEEITASLCYVLKRMKNFEF